MVLLSFDIEEFDLPLEYKGEIPFEEQISVSQIGLENILNLLKKHEIKATFFTTVVFAEHSKYLIERLLSEGHELASHTWYHSQFEIEDLKKSKERLEELFPTRITGIRMPRMMNIDESAVANAGYLYNSSINPTYLPGRYNNLKYSRKYFFENNVLQIPASVSPYLRIPLFWLSFRNFPFKFYQFILKNALRKDQYLNIYFHPWEFADIKNPKYKMPSYTNKDTGEAMIKKIEKLILWLKSENQKFGTLESFSNHILKKYKRA